MREFRVVSPRATNGTKWLVCPGLALGGIVSVMLGSGRTEPLLYPVIEWVGISAIVASLFLAGFFWGTARMKRQLAFVLTDNDLTRKRSGWPDVQIPFSEIRSVKEKRDWLIVEEAVAGRRIAVPRDVNDFELLRSELAKYARPSSPSGTRHGISFLGGLGVLLLSIVCWWLALFSSNAGLVRGSGVVILVLLGWSGLYALKLRLLRSAPVFVLLILSVIWTAALAFACLRLARPMSLFLAR
jgi:hypothetical protein